MSKPFQPMLAAKVKNTHDLKYPLLASYKFDGIRATVKDGIVYSRSGKPIPNRHVQALFGEYEHLDGELVLGDPNSKDTFRRTTSAVMSKEGTPDVMFYVFDHTKFPLISYLDRLSLIYAAPNVIPVTQTFMDSHLDVLEFEDRALQMGYEGVILRSVSEPYKFGRATLKSQGLLKLKRFVDAEATIVGATEMMRKDSDSSTGLLGSFTCVTRHGLLFEVGTGMTTDERSYYWEYKDDYLGSMLKYKYFDVGDYELPRHPVFLGIRDEADL